MAAGFCPQCGTQRPEPGLRYCASCGYDFWKASDPSSAAQPTSVQTATAPPAAEPASPAQLTPPPRGRSWGRIALVVVVALLLLGAIANGMSPVGSPAAEASPAERATPAARPSTNPTTPAPLASTQPRQAPVTVSGNGIANSAPFHLNAGDYYVTWTATPDHETGCYHGADLDSTEVSVFESIGNEILESAAPKTSSTYLYGIEDANYFVRASSGCSWTYTFTQQ